MKYKTLESGLSVRASNVLFNMPEVYSHPDNPKARPWIFPESIKAMLREMAYYKIRGQANCGKLTAEEIYRWLGRDLDEPRRCRACGQIIRKP